MSRAAARRRGAPLFDHLMHWVPDMPTAVTAYLAAGFPLRTNPPRKETGVHNGGWWKRLHYVEVLAVVDPHLARTTTAYGGFTHMILPAVERTLAAGGGALNFAVAVDDVTAAITAMRAAGRAAEQHTVRLKVGSFTIAAFTIGWITDGPPWAPFVIRYHPILRAIQKALLPLLGRRQPALDIHELVIEVPDPAASATWLSTTLGLTQHDADRPSVDLGVCTAVFVPGSADRITTVVLTGPGAPAAVIAGLGYRPPAAAGQPGPER